MLSGFSAALVSAMCWPGARTDRKASPAVAAAGRGPHKWQGSVSTSAFGAKGDVLQKPADFRE
jgi:hypothetical protein